MTFTLIDVILVLALFCFITAGFMFGLIRSIGSLIAIVAGTWAAGYYFQPFADWLTPILMGNAIAAKITAFLAVYIIINRLVVLFFHFIDKGFSIMAIIPFMKSFNRLGGVILGAAEGILTLGILLYVISKFAPDSGFVRDTLNGSQIAHYLVWISTVLTKLLPDAFDKVKSVF